MKNNFTGVLIFVGFATGILLTWQFNTEVPIEGNFPSDEVEAREELLKKFLDEQSYLQSRIVSLRKQIEESQNKLEEQTEFVNLELLENLKKDVGLTEVTGPGIEILLNDSPPSIRDDIDANESYRVQASDLRDIVNILNAASAEAISINNQRVISTSPISSVGTTILVNNAHIAPPFNISAVGDTDLILERLLNQSLLPVIYNKRKNYGVVFDIFKKIRINIPIYNGDLKVNYLTPVK